MEVEWMNHTGFVVSDMERSLEFYQDLLGLKQERNQILEGEFISELAGYPDARLHIVYLGTGDLRHSVELIQYLNPAGTPAAMPERHQVGASHLGVIVDDLDAFYAELSRRGVRFVSPPAIRPGAVYPMASKGCYMQDPDGNWLELLERPTAPEGTTQA
jgi:catechol 2,3-dioxygenase-like lactoylglutathione lyase family enzyme